MNIVIVGGGSAGWMSAAMLINEFPQYSITVIESPDVPIVGVGESTINGLRQFCNYLGIDESSFLKFTDGSYKLSIKFTDFYKKDDGGFLYPFGIPSVNGTRFGLNDWLIKKYAYPDTPVTDFAECFSPQAIMCKNNKFFKNPNYSVMDSYDSDLGLAYHFDATKFGRWLREEYCLPKGVIHIADTVTNIDAENDNITSLTLSNGSTVTADLFVDCTGFQSLLMDKTLKEPFISYSDMLPNNKAWATQLPYADKEKELEPFTNCTAINNGWVWNIPLWSRLGTGYVYSDNFISKEDALEEFKQHLQSNKMVIPRTKEEVDNLKFKELTMRVGIHKRTWVGNCVAIGLAAGFIEPLESNGLYTIHQFLFELIRALSRGYPTEWDKNAYNYSTFKMFNEFAEFVAIHYSLSRRDDTEYWKSSMRKDYFSTVKKSPSTFDSIVDNRAFAHTSPLSGGYSWIQAGMNYFPLDSISAKLGEMECLTDYNVFYKDEINFLDARKKKWEAIINQQPTLYEYLRDVIYV
jgi:tryptophan halogenase